MDPSHHQAQFITPRPVARFIFLFIRATSTHRSTAPGHSWGRVL